MKWHLLLLSTLTVLRGIFAQDNECLLACTARDGELNLIGCGITDGDVAAGQLAACFDNAGRSDLTSIDLSENGIETLPAAIFEGFTSLTALDISDNLISTLPPGIFDSLPLLRNLQLEYNSLATLSSGIFDQLSSLVFLDLYGNGLTTLPAGLFEGLSSLESLGLFDNSLTTLPAGLFEGLSSLEELDIRDGNDLECLPTVGSNLDNFSSYSSSITIGDICGCELEDGTNPCGVDTCTPGEVGFTCDPLCPNGEAVCDDPHMQGLRGQRIDWSGVDGGWYALIHGDDVSINVRLTAPLPDDFPDRQLVTGLSVLSQGHALTVEVKSPYDIATDGCPDGVSPCLADGGLRIIVDEEKVENTLLLRTSSRELPVADGAFLLSASNLPVECRQFGGDKIWARMYEEWMHGTRDLASGDISFEAWLTSFDRMAAPDWCVKYIAENDLVDLQSTHAIFKIETSTGVTVRLNAGVNFQGGGERDWDERVLPDLEFWQMGVGVDGLDIENPALSGILGETARPVFDDNGKAVMEGFEAFRGIVEDYRVSSALGSQFALLDTAEERYE